MSLQQIEQGLFKLDFIDNHAILGVPVDAEIKDIRKRYLQVARRLHPDSSANASEAEKQQATELLSKMVNPAYEKLSQERDRPEYLLMLRLKGQQAVNQRNSINLQSEAANNLLQDANAEQAYKAALSDLSEQLYQSLEQAPRIIGQISELNMAYLMRKELKGETIGLPPKQPVASGTSAAGRPSSSATPAASAPPPPPAAPQKMSVVDQYYRRAEELFAKENFAKAILELRDALKEEPTNSRCHSLMGTIYLKQNQIKMARIHFDQALKSNPHEATALEGKQKLEKLEQKGRTQATTAQTSNQKTTKPNKSGGGFFGLFGGKK